MTRDRHIGATAPRPGVDRHKSIRIGTLWRNASMEGDVTMTTDFLDLSNIEKLDVLRDALWFLHAEYEATLKGLHARTDFA